MGLKHKIIKLLKDPIGVLRRRLHVFLEPYKYSTPDGYRAEKYWSDRLSKYRFDLRGVGIEGLSHGENEYTYSQAREVFLSLCLQQGVDLGKSRLLDVCCGTGFYAKIFAENGGTDYLGIDITDTLFPELRKNVPNFKFRKLDVSCEEVDGRFDLIVMLDVT